MYINDNLLPVDIGCSGLSEQGICFIIIIIIIYCHSFSV